MTADFIIELLANVADLLLCIYSKDESYGK